MRLVRSYDRRCERAREWLSLALDGEVSRFERALVDRHVGSCPECAAFGAELRAFTDAVRATPLEPLEHAVAIPTRRTPTAFLRTAQAAAAVAMLAVGVGALSSSLRDAGRQDRPVVERTQAQIRNGLRLRQLQVGEEIVLARQAAVSSPVREGGRQLA